MNQLMNRHDILSHNPNLTKSQVKILNGAKQCIQRWGIDKTSINDLAKQAGVTRQTVYAYYPDKDAVVQAALLYSVYELARKLLYVIDQQPDTYHRLLEVLVVVVEQLPNEPYFTLMNETFMMEVLEKALSNQEGMHIAQVCLEEVLADKRLPDQEMIEVVEVLIRCVLSIILFRGNTPLRGNALKDYLARYVLSSSGIQAFCA